VALECGDHVAWERFYRDNFDFVRNIAAKFTTSAEDAQELAQKFCCEIPERIRNYAGWCSLRGWLCSVVPSVVRDHVNKVIAGLGECKMTVPSPGGRNLRVAPRTPFYFCFTKTNSPLS